jgi:hypothetical protein
MCAIGDVYRGAMPSALLLESETVISQKTDVLLMKAHFLMMSSDIPSPTAAVLAQSSGYYCNFK